MTDLTPIVNATIALVAALITAFVIPWLKSRTTAQERDEMLKWVEIAVAAAQQMYHQMGGKERKEYVRNYLNAKGYDVNDKDVDNAIEAAVLRLHREMETV